MCLGSWQKNLRKRDHTLFLGSGVHPGPRRNEKSNRNIEHSPKSLLTDPPRTKNLTETFQCYSIWDFGNVSEDRPKDYRNNPTLLPECRQDGQLSTILGNLASHLGHSRYQLQSSCCYFRRPRARPNWAQIDQDSFQNIFRLKIGFETSQSLSEFGFSRFGNPFCKLSESILFAFSLPTC
jgi:hypothetical protein